MEKKAGKKLCKKTSIKHMCHESFVFVYNFFFCTFFLPEEDDTWKLLLFCVDSGKEELESVSNCLKVGCSETLSNENCGKY